MTTGDHDADAIRNQRLQKSMDRLVPLLPRLEKLLDALDGGAGEADANATLSARVEAGLAKLEEKVNAIGDLPDRLRQTAEKADAAVQAAELAKADLAHSKTQHESFMSRLRSEFSGSSAPAPKPANARAANPPPQAPPPQNPPPQMAGEQVVSGVQQIGIDQGQIDKENAETLADVKARTERPQAPPPMPTDRPVQAGGGEAPEASTGLASGSEAQAKVQAFPDAGKPQASSNPPQG